MAKVYAGTIFRYEPLQKDEIRFCRIRRTEQGSLELELQHFSISNNLVDAKQNWPAYTALSYTWGSERPLYSVRINQRVFFVRQNLHSFLEHARTEPDVWFWIDQICIDQSNISERNAEVSRMDKIYSNAEIVRVWLGNGNEQTSHAMEALAEFNVVVADAFHKTNGWMDKDEAMEHEFEQRNVCIKGLLRDRAHWVSGLTEFLNLSYWTRQWIVQELWLAKHLCLQCGATKLTELKGPPHKFHDDNDVFLACLADAISCLQTLTNRGNRAGKQLFASWQGPELHLSLWQALRNFNGDCSDPRDKVFGILGIVESRQRVQVDYTMTVEQVFWATTHAMYSVQDLEPGLDVFGLGILSNVAESMGIISLSKVGDSMVGMMTGSFSIADISETVERIYDGRQWKWPPATDVMDERWTKNATTTAV